MNQRTLKIRVRELGEIRQRVGELQTAERELSKTVREAMTAARLDSVQVNGYVAQMAEQRRLQLDVRKFRRKAGEKLFLECVKVDLKTARRHFEASELEKLGEVVRSLQLRISQRPTKGL